MTPDKTQIEAANIHYKWCKSEKSICPSGGCKECWEMFLIGFTAACKLGEERICDNCKYLNCRNECKYYNHDVADDMSCPNFEKKE